MDTHGWKRYLTCEYKISTMFASSFLYNSPPFFIFLQFQCIAVRMYVYWELMLIFIYVDYMLTNLKRMNKQTLKDRLLRKSCRKMLKSTNRINTILHMYACMSVDIFKEGTHCNWYAKWSLYMVILHFPLYLYVFYTLHSLLLC